MEIVQKKLLSIISSLSMVNLLRNLQMDKAYKKKTLNRFIPSVFFSGSLLYNRWNTICNFVICLSVYPLVNITYHWWKTIGNSVGKLTVAIIFAIILFQLCRIYRWMWYVGNLLSNILKNIYIFLKNILNISRKIIKIKYIKRN
jgi:hypothetical protein